MNLNKTVQDIIKKDKTTLTKVVEKINKNYAAKSTVQNYSNKLRSGSIKLFEFYRILKVLEYDIEITSDNHETKYLVMDTIDIFEKSNPIIQIKSSSIYFKDFYEILKVLNYSISITKKEEIDL